MTILTGNYEETNGVNRPKPSLEGAWAFYIVRDHSATRFDFTGTYADARQAVRAAAKLIGGVDRIVLLP